MEHEIKKTTAVKVAAPAEETGIPLTQYVDAITTALAKDYEELPQSVKNLFLYSKQGNNIALLHLSECYAQGTFFPADFKISRRLLEESARCGNEVAIRLQDPESAKWSEPIVITYPQDKTETPEIGIKLNPDTCLSVVLLNALAESGNSEAQCALGLMCYRGKGVKWDGEKAMNLWSLSGAAGNPYAQYNLYSAYLSGLYIPADPEKAMEYLHKAAENGCARAQQDLGICYSCGIRVSKDNEKSIKWTRMSVGQDIAKERLCLESPLHMDTKVSKEAA